MRYILLVSVVLSLSWFLPNSAFAQEMLFHESDFAGFQRMAAQENKAYMVYFTRTNCLPCQKMQAETFKDPELVALAQQKILAYKANVDDFQSMDIAEQYKVSVYPTIIFFTPQGEIIGKLFGFQAAAKLIWLIQRHT